MSGREFAGRPSYGDTQVLQHSQPPAPVVSGRPWDQGHGPDRRGRAEGDVPRGRGSGPGFAPVPAGPPAPQASGGVSRLPLEEGVGKTVYAPHAASKEQIVGVLVAVAGKLEGELYAIRDGKSVLGRAPKCELRFSERDQGISRVHAQIIHDHGLFAIEPLSAENPTLVNRERIQGRAELPDRAEISIGLSEFRFLVVSG